jgi:hypothetical protein
MDGALIPFKGSTIVLTFSHIRFTIISFAGRQGTMADGEKVIELIPGCKIVKT